MATLKKKKFVGLRLNSFTKHRTLSTERALLYYLYAIQRKYFKNSPITLKTNFREVLIRHWQHLSSLKMVCFNVFAGQQKVFVLTHTRVWMSGRVVRLLFVSRHYAVLCHIFGDRMSPFFLLNGLCGLNYIKL